jgi:hypothetical protein
MALYRLLVLLAAVVDPRGHAKAVEFVMQPLSP